MMNSSSCSRETASASREITVWRLPPARKKKHQDGRRQLRATLYACFAERSEFASARREAATRLLLSCAPECCVQLALHTELLSRMKSKPQLEQLREHLRAFP